MSEERLLELSFVVHLLHPSDGCQPWNGTMELFSCQLGIPRPCAWL